MFCTKCPDAPCTCRKLDDFHDFEPAILPGLDKPRFDIDLDGAPDLLDQDGFRFEPPPVFAVRTIP